MLRSLIPRDSPHLIDGRYLRGTAKHDGIALHADDARATLDQLLNAVARVRPDRFEPTQIETLAKECAAAKKH